MITGCRKFDNLFVSRGGEGEGVAGCAPVIFGPGPKLAVIWPIVVFQKLERFLRVYSFLPVCILFPPCCVIRSIFTTFECYFYHSYKEWFFLLLLVSRLSGKERAKRREKDWYRRIDIRGNKKHTKYNGRYKFNSERWFQLLSLFFSFFFPSTLRVVEKEGRVQISSAATKRRNFVVRVNTDEPAALTSAPLSHFTLFIRLSATLSRPRPFIRPYFQSTDLLYSTYVSLRMHLANLGSRLTSYSKCRPHFSLPRLWLSRDFSRYWPRSLRLTGIDCSEQGKLSEIQSLNNAWIVM